MAQIIKHRRGSITQLKDVTARISELVVATGSIGDLNGPFLFVGETEGVAGAYRSVSKIYQGAAAPTITVGSHGSVVDGTPFYASGNKSLYILSKDGNARLDLTGNIEGNTISNVTITNLTGTTITSTNSNITSLTSSNANVTNLTGATLTTTNGNITSLTGSNLNVTNITGSTISGSNVHISNNLKVSGTTDLGGALNVTGNTILNGSVTVTGLTDNRLVLVGTGGLLEDSVNLTFDGNKFDIGQGNFQIDTTTGDIRTSGSIVMKGNITVGDSSADNIILAGEVSSSIVPDVHDSFDLGSTDKNWRNLHVSGTAYVNILEAQSISLDGITVFEDLVVSGSSYLGTGGGDQVVVSGSIFNDALTEKRLVVAGANGLITDYSGLTFDNGNLNLSGALEVTNIQGTGSLYLKPDLNDSRFFQIYNTASPSGNDIHFKGNTDFNFFGDDTNYLKIDDSAQTATLVGVNGVIVSSSLQVTGSVFTDKILGTGSLYLQPDQIDGRYFEIYNTGASDVHIKSSNGLSFFGDDTNYLMINDSAQTATLVGVNGVIVSSSLNVTGSSTLNSTLEVKGATGLNSTLDVTGSSTLNSTLEVKGATGLNSTLDVTGSAILKSTLEVQGATGLNSTLDVTGSATLKSTLQVDSTSQLKGAVGMNSSLDVTGSATLKSTLQVNSTSELRGAVGMNSTLDVTGSAQFKSTINVDSEATLASATVEDLTQDRIVTVGAGGSLIDSSGFTYNGTVFKIGNGQFEVDTNDGDVRTSGSLTTNGLTNNGDLTVNGVLTVTGNTQLQSNLYVSGNLEVLGSATNVIIQSQTIELDDNIIRLNAYSPFERYAGFEVIDSGSSGISGSVVWDSLNDYWMFVSSSGQSSKMIGTTAGTYGSENSLTDTYFPIATGTNTIGDSLLRYSGTTLSFNTNKFTVDSSSGDTAISGNFTLSYSGGTDNGNNTSAIMFRNSSNVVGFVSTTETTDVLDGILGYKNSDGALKFSTVIDGGTY